MNLFIRNLLATSVAAGLAAAPAARAESQTPTQPEAEKKAAVTKPVKHHSHVTEKTGAPQAQPAAEATPKDKGTDRSKHLHPRDGK